METTTKGQTMITALEKKAEVREAIYSFVDFMNTEVIEFFAKRYPSLEPDVYEVNGGRKYIRIVARRGDSFGGAAYGGSVHCFVDAETGGVYKAATWKAPALNGERFNLLDEASFAELKAKWDAHGGYLYKK